MESLALSLDRPGISRCEMCRFFAVFQRSSREKGYHIRAFSIFKSYPGISHAKVPPDLREHDSIYLAIVPGGKSSKSIPEAVNCCWKTGFISHHPARGIDPNHFHGGKVANFINYDTLTEWLSFCKDNHSQ